MVDGGESYALREANEFRESAIWRRWGLVSDAQDAAFVDAETRKRHLDVVDISFGVYPRPFPFDRVMNPGVMRSALEYALRESDGMAWFYTEEGDSAWEADQLDLAFLTTVEDARAAVLGAPAQQRYSVEDLHRFQRSPFDADLNGVVDDDDAIAIEGEARRNEDEDMTRGRR